MNANEHNGIHKAYQGILVVRNVKRRAISQKAKDELELGLRLIINGIDEAFTGIPGEVKKHLNPGDA